MLLLTLAIFLLANAQYLPITFLMRYLGFFQFPITFLLLLLFIVSFASGVLRLLFDCIRLLMNKHYKVHFMRVGILGIYIPGVIVISFVLGQLLLVDMTMNIAISHAKPLIQAIEACKRKHGVYPEDIDVAKYSPCVGNVENYRYVKTDSTGYYVYFLLCEFGGLENIHVQYDRFYPGYPNKQLTFLHGDKEHWYYYYKY